MIAVDMAGLEWTFAGVDGAFAAVARALVVVVSNSSHLAASAGD